MPPASDELQPGLQVGAYRLLAPIANPGGGAVWRAQRVDADFAEPADPATPTAAVLKFTTARDPEGPEPTDHPRMRREARVLQSLRHPGIVPLLDSGEHGCRLWIALEAVDGPDLSAFTTPARRLVPRLAVHLIADAAVALDHAHRAGVLHRDLKPANLVLAGAAVIGEARARLIDFGITTELAADRTATGVLPGSPAYMSPEQLAGADPDVAGDVFALGVTLYELLAGARPWQGDSLGALLRSLARDPPAPLTERCAGLPTDVVAAVHQCLARDPSRRPAGAAALARTLRAAWPPP